MPSKQLRRSPCLIRCLDGHVLEEDNALYCNFDPRETAPDPELAEAARRVIDATGVGITWEIAHAGVDIMEQTGTPLPEETLEAVRRNGVALKAPITTPIGSGFRSVNVALRKALDLYACVRPVQKLCRGAPRYQGVDIVIVRENTEDPLRRRRV